MNNQHAARTKFMVELALMVAIIFVMAFTPLGYFQTMGLSITFLTVPVAVGAIILGPKGGAICGLAFGITSFIQCFGMSAFGTLLLGVNPVFTFLVCVPTRILDGWLTGLIYAGLKEENVAEVLAAADGRTLSGKGRMRRLYMLPEPGSLPIWRKTRIRYASPPAGRARTSR